MIRSALTAILVSGAIALIACQSSTDTSGGAPDYNVVLISVDALRADHVGTYGYDRPTTPFLDSLAADSIVFERAYAPSSFTRQSVSALLTGRLPTSGGSVSLAAAPHENAETLSRLFRAAGVRTGMFSNQPLLEDRGFTRGFEGIQIAGLENGAVTQTAGNVTANALQFIDDYAGERFMIFAHYVEPHQPYTPPAETAALFGVDASDVSVASLAREIDGGGRVDRSDPRVTQLMARYDAEIRAVDNAVRSLVDGLAERGLADKTVVVVTGSQGQEFLEHGYLGHAWTLYEEQLRVPLIVHAPDLVAPQRVATPVSTIDVYPTLVGLFDLDLDVDAWQPDGSSFLSDALDIRALDEPILAELVIRERCVVRAVVRGEWKYIAEYIPCPVEKRKAIDEGYVDLVQAIMAGEVEAPPIWGDVAIESIFNLSRDPGETVNQIEVAEDILPDLRARLGDYQTYSELYALKAQEDVVTPEMRRALCGFGYGSC
jgi:arylsulfatase A-like enzyme